MKKLMCNYCEYEARGDSNKEVMDEMMGHYNMAHGERVKMMSDIDKKVMTEESLMKIREE
jgi:predicted small metal-binding protein